MRSEPRFGMMTMVAEKRNGTWLVVVAQNTNAVFRRAAGASGH